jgi:hypothetical protein
MGPFSSYRPDTRNNILFIREASSKLKLDHETVNKIRKDSIHQAINLAEYLELDIGEVFDILAEANEYLANLYFSVERLYLGNLDSPSGIHSASPEKAEKQQIPASL